MTLYTVYLIAFRTALYLLAIWLVAYFFVNSHHFDEVFEPAMAQKLDGSMTAERWFWGPLPWEVRAIGFRALRPNGEPVIEVDRVVAEVDLTELLGWVLDGVLLGDEPFRIHVTRADVHGFVVRLHFDDDNHLALVDAFSEDYDKDSPGEEDFQFDSILISNAAVSDGRALLEFPSWSLDLDVDSAEADLEVAQSGEIFTLSSRLVRVNRGLGTIPMERLPDGSPGPLRAELRRAYVKGFRWVDDGFDLDRVQLVAENSVDVDATGGMDFSGLDLNTVPSFHGLARIHSDALPPLATTLTGGLFSGDVDSVVRANGRFDDVAGDLVLRSRDAKLAGRALADLGLVLSLRHDPSKGALGYSLSVPLVEGHGLGGHIRGERLVWTGSSIAQPLFSRPGAPAPIPTLDGVSGHLWLNDVDLGALLTALGRETAPAPSRGHLDASVELRAGRFPPIAPDGSDGPPDELPTPLPRWQARADLDAEIRWSGDSPWPLALISRMGDAKRDGARLDGAVLFAEHIAERDAGPQIPAGDTVFIGEGLRLRSGSDTLAIEGGVSLDGGGLALSAKGSLARLADLLRPLGIEGVNGRLRLRSAQLSGSLSAPQAEAQFSVDDLRAVGQSWGKLSTTAVLRDGAIHVHRLSALGDWGRLEGSGSLQVLPSSSEHAARPYRFSLSDVVAHDVDLATLFPSETISGHANAQISSLTGDLLDPPSTLRGGGHITLTDVRVAGKRIRHAEASVSATGEGLVVRDAKADLPGRGRVTGQLHLDRGMKHMALDLELAPISLRAFTAVGRGNAPASGTVGLKLHAEGRVSDPRVAGELRLRKTRVELGGRGEPRRVLKLGDADIRFERDAGGALRFASDAFFPGFALLPGSEIELRGLSPQSLLMKIAVDRYDPTALLPELASWGVQARISAAADLALDLRARHASQAWRVDVRMPTDGLHLTQTRRRLSLANTAPFEASFSPAGVRLPLFSVKGSDGTELTLCGGIDESGHLDMAVAGELDLRALRFALEQALSSLSGRLRLRGSSGALPDACADAVALGEFGAMRVSGSLDAPLVTGAIEMLASRDSGVRGDKRDARDLRSLQLQIRGSGRRVDIAEGGTVAFAPGRDRRPVQRIWIPQETPVRGRVEDGSFALWGWTDLRHFHPDGGRLELEGTDLFYSAPKTLNVTFNSRLTMSFEHLDDPERRHSGLSGEIAITEGTYYRSFDTFARALGGALSREQEVPTQSISRLVPALAETALDIRVVGSDVGVTSGFTFGRMDVALRMDLRVGGTLAEPRVWDRVEIIPGGVITYNVVRREFEVTRGAIDFRGDPTKPYLDLEARTEIAYYEDRRTTAATEDVSRLTDDERIVTITVRVKGPYPEFDLELSSDNRAFDQADLQSFILTGAPRDQTRVASSERTINLFTEDLANLARSLLLSAFVDAVTLGVTTQGGIDWGVIASLGRSLKLRARVVQEGADKRYRARFELKITDRLSLEGQLKVNEEESRSTQTYESKLRYRIPLD